MAQRETSTDAGAATVARRCRGCGTAALIDVVDLGPQPLREFIGPSTTPELRPLVAVACDACGLLQLAPRAVTAPSAGRRRVTSSGIEHGHATGHSETVIRHADRFARELRSRLRDIGAASPRVLQLDSGDGSFLAPLARAGATVSGLERDPRLVALATSAGVPTREASIDDQVALLRSGEAAADVVVVSHVLAHLDDLDGAIAAIAATLTPRGLAAIEFHHAGAIHRGQFDILSHAHRTYLTLVALMPILERHGLHVLDASTHRLHGGSARVWVGRARPAARPDRVRRLLDRERREGLDGAAGYSALGRHAARIRDRLRTFVGADHGAGRRLAAYGAPGRGVTLLNFAGLGASDIPYTVDRDASKHGCVMAGTGIVIEPVAVLADRRPTELLILPWPLAREIRGQLAGVPWTGRTVVAMPRLSVA